MSDQTTHWRGCYAEPGHQVCALREIARLERERDNATAKAETLHPLREGEHLRVNDRYVLMEPAIYTRLHDKRERAEATVATQQATIRQLREALEALTSATTALEQVVAQRERAERFVSNERGAVIVALALAHAALAPAPPQEPR